MSVVNQALPGQGHAGEAHNSASPFWLAAVILALVVGYLFLFWDGFGNLLYNWQRPEYSYGYFVAPIALYLFLKQLASTQRRTEGSGTLTAAGSGLGLLIVVVAIILGLAGDLAHMPSLNGYGIILSIAGLVLLVMGMRRGWRYWPAVLFLVFMLPLPAFLYWRLSAELQLISSKIGVMLISLFGVPVLLDGNVIDLGTFQLQVAEACSGLRYLFPLMSLGYLFAVLYRGPIWQKLLLFLSTVPITVLMNSFRIGVVGLLVDRFGIDQAEGFLHLFEGWIIFIACLVILYLEAVVLQLMVRNRGSVAAMLEFDLGELTAPLRRWRDFPVSRALVVATGLILATGLASHFVPSRPQLIPDRTPLVLFPRQLGDWQGGNPQLLGTDVEQVLLADDYLLVDYANQGSGPVNLFIAYYNSLNGEAAIHSPEQCLPGGGWEVSGWSTVDTGVKGPSGQPLYVDRATMRKGIQQELVYFWLVQRGRPMTNFLTAKLSVLADLIVRGRSDGGLVRLVTPVLPTENVAAADTRLRGFLATALPQLPKFLPD